jgi:HEAT repeat protein
MKITSKRLGIAAALATLLGAAWLAGRSPEPSYQGRTMEKWFYLSLKIEASAPTATEQEAFRALCPAAIPYLLERLERPTTGWGTRLLGRISEPASRAIRQSREAWQHRAAYLLGEIGPAAAPTVPHLLPFTNSPNWGMRSAATVALMKIRQAPLDPLIVKLKDLSDSQTWLENAITVGQFGAAAEPAIPLLIDALHQTNNIIQGHAIDALGMIGRQPARCLPEILPFLNSPDTCMRQKTIGALLSFGANAVPYRKDFQQALNDPDPWVRFQAGRGLKLIEVIESANLAPKN